MFVCSVRASTVKLFGFMALTLLLIGLAVFLGGGESVMAAADATLVDYSGMKTNEDRVAFIKSFGLEIEEVPEECAFTMPEDFDRVIAGYNELQKKICLKESNFKEYDKKLVKEMLLILIHLMKFSFNHLKY